MKGNQRQRTCAQNISYLKTIEHLMALIEKSSDYHESTSHVAAVVILVVAEMESFINQALDWYKTYLNPIAEILVAKCSLLEKLEVISARVHERPLEKNQEPYQSFKDLCCLRNFLVHDKPKEIPWPLTYEQLANTDTYKRFKKRWSIPTQKKRTYPDGSEADVPLSKIEAVLTPECAEWAFALLGGFKEALCFGCNRFKYTAPSKFEPNMPPEFDKEKAHNEAFAKACGVSKQQLSCFWNINGNDNALF